MIDGPVVVGGLGGSGTRVVARALESAGVFIGRHLNEAHDNLVFTAMFKRPHWVEHASADDIREQFETFERYMLGVPATDADLRRLASSLTDPDPTVSIEETRSRLSHALERHDPSADTWGWKEPNSHIFIAHIARCFPAARFVYLVRHGLDMAFSKNMTQARIWGPSFGVDFPADASLRPQAQLEYWLRATGRAIDVGRAALGDRFLVVTFDDLSSRPVDELGRLYDALQINVDPADVTAAAQDVVRPPSTGRWRDRRVSDFSADQIARLEAFGFSAS